MQKNSPISAVGKFTRRNFHTMSSRAFRPTAAILSVLLLAGAPVHAGPVAIREVIQVIGSYQNPPELRVRSFSQTVAPISGVNGSTRVDSRVNTSNDVDLVDLSTVDAISSETLLSGVAISADDPEVGIDVIDAGDVEGTICDCGEITVPGGFPKWPLLFLAAVPFFFIHDCDDCDTPTPTPTPTPPNTPTPEPASLLLFGSGLAAFGAGLRRRYAKAKVSKQVGEEG
jgi:PEP-CTERM motif